MYFGIKYGFALTQLPLSIFNKVLGCFQATKAIEHTTLCLVVYV